MLKCSFRREQRRFVTDRQCRRLPFLAMALVLAACHPNPETAHVAVEPRTAPVRTITSFNESLRCMDELFLAMGKRDVFVTSAGIPDATGMITAGTKEMLITAVAEMSAKSGAFRFVDYDPTQIDVQFLSQLVGLRPEFVAPSYYIRGAITQLDSNVLDSHAGAGVSLPSVDLAVSSDQVVSVMSVDLNIGKLVTRQIMPGMSASNSIAVVRSGHGGDVGGVIGKAGLTFSVALDRSEGFHQAARDLIELSTIEVLGKLTRVPYWQCLQIDQTNPTYRAEAREWFDAMGETERVRFVKTGLVRAAYYEGPVDGNFDPALRDATARYQAEHDLVPNGRVDFDLYYRLLAAGTRPAEPAKAPPPARPTEPAPVAEAPPPPEMTPVDIVVRTDQGEHPTFRVNDLLVVEAQTNRDGFLYCYYQDADGSVARIFPNRFQPNAFVRGGTAIQIPPGPTRPFNIRFDKGRAREAVACVGAPIELGLQLPQRLKTHDLAPLPVHGLDDLIEDFRHVGGERMGVGKMFIEVM
jgi:peptidoglycan hydrolase-like protein with peptidoglycan-binding domain